MKLKNNDGFSILMALGMTTFLMLVVTGIALLYMREMRISRLGYDEIVAYSSAEGAFEYAMLKIRNHSDGFEDSVSQADSDGKAFFTLSTPRSQYLETSYTIESTSKDHDFTVAEQSHLIVPLFVSDASYLQSGLPSKDPLHDTGTKNTTDLQVSGLGTAQKWVIMAVDSTTNKPLGLAGSGNITTNTKGIIRHKDSDCYDNNGNKMTNCTGQVAEELVYFWDETKSLTDFLTDVKNPYLMLYNEGSSQLKVNLASSGEFTLPQYSVQARSGQKNTLQIFQFSEDKSKYYDLLKYGVSNIKPTP